MFSWLDRRHSFVIGSSVLFVFWIVGVVFVSISMIGLVDIVDWYCACAIVDAASRGCHLLLWMSHSMAVRILRALIPGALVSDEAR